MRDVVFYNTGGQARGLRRAVVPLRRLVRRLLLPIFQRLVEILQGFDGDLERLAERQGKLETLRAEFQTLAGRQAADHDAQAKHQDRLEAFCLDYDALVRRLAALEDHVEVLLQPFPDLQPLLDSGTEGGTSS